MAAIRHSLQSEIFSKADERLVGVVSVTKVGRKKKARFLCASVNSEQPPQAAIHQVKRASEKEPFKKKQTWKLDELIHLDGKGANSTSPDFDLRFDKTYRWTASSVAEKNAFITCLWKLCHKCLQRKKPEFDNVDRHRLEEQLKVFDPSHLGNTTAPVEEAYEELSAKEETDLEQILSGCEWSISNVEALTEKLTEELACLDDANIHSIIASEEQVVFLLSQMDTALWELQKIEDKLCTYDSLLQEVRDAMEDMDDKDKRLQIEDRNHERLLDEVESLVSKLDLGLVAEDLLQRGDLSNPQSLSQCTAAALALQQATDAVLSPGMSMLAAVSHQKQNFDQLTWSFVRRLSTHLSGVFVKQADDGMDVMGIYQSTNSSLMLRSHTVYHQELLPYSKLMGWLRDVDSKQYQEICKLYSAHMGRVYDKELKGFMELVKQSLVSKSHHDKKILKHSRLSMTQSTVSLGKSLSKENIKAGGSMVDLTARSLDSPTHGAMVGAAEERVGKFDEAFHMVLEQLEPLCQAEQYFCRKFFALDTPGAAAAGTESPDGIIRRRRKRGANIQAQKSRIGITVRGSMEELFPCLESELQGFVQFGDRLDGINSLTMVSRVSQHVMAGETSDQDSSSVFHLILGKILIIAKRLFDRFVDRQINLVKEMKVPKKHRCGILPCVSNFKVFAIQAENIIRGSDRRADLDKAYKLLMDAILVTVDRVALEHLKTPSDVVAMENFHHLYDMLSRLKISALETTRDFAKLRYKNHLDAYIQAYLGKPLEKLSAFFDGIEDLVASGIKYEEVGYQLAFNKAELRKNVKEYPGERVKKGLDALYRKVEKHLCEEENLLQVVWHSMQDDFIQQYKHFEELINKCYPGSGIAIEFSLAELLSYFSMIAQQH
ncbi:exocyst complex component 1-like isoform X2 [Corticium candelabrum]|uniref:exocyst complex component 1-like isoform X2 n=1 Tax=Corticium candelabrum TaxID=121492 RepID=UPI002E2693EA|nr:exocyst complex component 1-like isoform X2 [Corticium candelabrum]